MCFSGVALWNECVAPAGDSALPFGGAGLSGNHRPGGSLAADYCSYPIGIIEQASLRAPQALPGIDSAA